MARTWLSSEGLDHPLDLVNSFAATFVFIDVATTFTKSFCDSCRGAYKHTPEIQAQWIFKKQRTLGLSGPCTITFSPFWSFRMHKWWQIDLFRPCGIINLSLCYKCYLLVRVIQYVIFLSLLYGLRKISLTKFLPYMVQKDNNWYSTRTKWVIIE